MSITTDSSDIQEFNEDLSDLHLKNKQLSSENDTLRKALRERDYEMNSKIQHYQISNETLLRTNKSLEKLTTSYTNLSDSKVYTSKMFELEQNENNLKRIIQSLNREIFDLKIEIEKMRISFKYEGKVDKTLISDYEQMFDIKNLDEERRSIFKEIMIDYEEVKKKNVELREKALNTITEKEIANMELREKLELTKSKNNEQMTKLLEEIKILKDKVQEKFSNETNLAEV